MLELADRAGWATGNDATPKAEIVGEVLATRIGDGMSLPPAPSNLCDGAEWAYDVGANGSGRTCRFLGFRLLNGACRSYKYGETR